MMARHPSWEDGDVYTLRCTGKLLARLGPVTEVDRESPTTVLGDWYGTLIHAPGMQLVLLVSERTLLPVVVPAREARTVTERFPLALGRALAELGVQPPAIEREVQAMAGPRIGKTASRQVLGSMNDFQRLMTHHPWPPRSLTALSLELAEAPCGPIGMRSSDDLTRELFASSRDLA
jgi:uncharacterized protein DUF6933